MPKIEGRKYEVKLDDGRVVSRQYAHYLLNKDKYDERRREVRYNTDEKIQKHKHYQKNWLERFEQEHGTPYWKWRREQKRDHKKPNRSKTVEEVIETTDV